jgi:hypothetical protein
MAVALGNKLCARTTKEICRIKLQSFYPKHNSYRKEMGHSKRQFPQMGYQR